MIQFTNTLAVRKPAELVFRFIANPETLPQWNYYILRVTKDGDAFRVERKTDVFTVTLKVSEANHKLIVETVPGNNPFVRRTMAFAAEGADTHITDTIDFNSRFPTLLEKVIRKRLKGAVAENLEKLRQLLETGRCTLQDGRISQLSSAT